MVQILEKVNEVVWGIPALLLIVGVGVYLSIRTNFAQLRMFPAAMRSFFGMLRRKDNKNGCVSSYRALCTALAATVGTGNIAGVAGAIAIGGPGAIFWMWVCALLGMVTKFAEATLAVRYRQKNIYGEYVGGPMYMIRNTMPIRWRWLASLYCFFGVVASFGVGNATQVNALIGGINSAIVAYGGNIDNRRNIFFGCIMAAIILLMLLGGMRRIGVIAENLVPFASAGYILLSLIVLLICHDRLSDAFLSIIRGAFTPQAVTGGVICSVFTALRVGTSRGVFTNEAGMGTASIAHAASEVEHPVQQGLMGIMEVFLDTIVICTMTALVILVSGVPIQFGEDTGVILTTQAFSAVLGEWVCIPLAIALCCFAFATVLGWGLYGIRCAQYLFGEATWKNFVWLQAGTAVVSAIMGTGTVWTLAEIVNGLMAIPNLIVLAYLTPELVRLVKQYKTSSVNNLAFFCR